MVDPKNYVVIDIETNGLNILFDDILSISFYRPDNGDLYTRYLPLRKWASLNEEACKINGITSEMIKDKEPLSNDEFQELSKRFDLYNRTLLHFGSIDKKFLEYYFQRKKIKNFDKLHFYNFKEQFITSSFSNGEYTKDNFCKAFKIKGVREIHSGANDCKLEWELFKKLNNNYVFCPFYQFKMVKIFKIPDDYYIPSSYFKSFPHFKKIRNLPKIRIKYEEIYSLKLSEKCNNKYDVCPQPSGFACESVITSMLNAIDVENKDFAIKNNLKLQLIGTFNIKRIVHEIPVIKNSDGTLKAVYKEDEKRIEETNKQMNNIKSEVLPLIDFIKKVIFKGKKIYSQELVINEEYKAFGYNDFSNESAVMEMKFGSNYVYDVNVSSSGVSRNQNKNAHKYQYFINRKNRDFYILAGSYGEFKIFKLNFYIGDEIKNYKLERHVLPKKIYKYNLDGDYICEYKSVIEATKDVNVTEKTIRECANGRYMTAGKFRWSYKKHKRLKALKHNKINSNHSCITRTTKHVFQFDLNGKFIAEYNSIREASKATGAPETKISMVCHKKRKKSGGYIWKYER